ncbi:MAG: nuclease A inhibitor family protein, partial [Myxococcales bacterium]
EAAVDGLLFMSESDYPFDYVQFPGAGKASAQDLAKLLGRPAGTPVEQRSMDDFFNPRTQPQSWWEPEQHVDAQKYRQLRQTLEGNLTDLRVVRVGEIEIGVYLVGRNRFGDLVGVRTTSIET